MDTYSGKTAGSNVVQAGRVGMDTPPTANPSCFGNVEDVTSTCTAMAQRVERIVSRMCGDYPAADSSDGKLQDAPNGLFESIDRQAHDIRASMHRIAAAMDRLEGQLP